MTSRGVRILCAFVCLNQPAGALLAATDQPNASPVISHEPVTKAMKGQALTMKAKVTDDKGEMGSVTLYYTLSKDAAPFKVPLKPAGLDYYVGTIDAGILSGITTISYYIEAQDTWGATKETPWYIVTFREPQPGDKVPLTGGESTPVKIPAPGSDVKDDSWPVGMIVGGAAVVVGGALLLADSGGGDSGGSSNDGGGDVGDKQGTYAGSVTTCLTLSGQQPSCESHACTIVVDSTGKVLSNNLREGQQLTGQLNGSDFTLTASADDEAQGITGEIFYNGNVVNNNTKIVGSVTGSQAGGPAGAGNYSGSFSATKQ